jgi:hypothetical protein
MYDARDKGRQMDVDVPAMRINQACYSRDSQTLV